MAGYITARQRITLLHDSVEEHLVYPRVFCITKSISFVTEYLVWHKVSPVSQSISYIPVQSISHAHVSSSDFFKILLELHKKYLPNDVS